MKTIQTKSGEVLLVKVPENAYEFRLLKSYIAYKYCETEEVVHVKNYSINSKEFICIGKFSELKDEGFEEFVEWSEFDEGVKQYFNDIQDCWNCKSAKESFQSLCKSQGIEDDLSNYLIIKKL